MTSAPTLKRSISLPFLVFYGLGTIVGGGIYALIGKVAGDAGIYTPVALLLSGLLALVSSFSFAELSSRFPVSAGEARYVQEGFSTTWLPRVVGWLVILTGIVSAAALSVATIGFLQDRIPVQGSTAIVILVASMGLIAAWGITQSVILVAAITLIEVGALIYAVIMADVDGAQLSATLKTLANTPTNAPWLGIFSGAFLAFYAFIGFEDMVNVAEEVQDAPRTLPIGIIISISLATVIYCVVGLVAVTAVPLDRLASSNTPVAEMVSDDTWYSSTGLWLVSLMTGVNGALVQIIMASRVAYGLAEQGQAPRWLGTIHPATRTPVRGTAAVICAVLLLALFFPLTDLARATSFIVLTVFAFVNFALWRVKRRDPDLEGRGPRYPTWLPITGAVACLAVLLFQTFVTLG